MINDKTVKSEIKKEILLELQNRTNNWKNFSKAPLIKYPALEAKNKLFTKEIKGKRSCSKNSA